MGTWYERAAERLRTHANADGGFGPRAGEPSEPEPTALAAMALGATGAQAWLALHQTASGKARIVPGAVESTAATPLVALALPVGAAQTLALDGLTHTQAQPNRPRGWGWTPTTYGWVEPTAWAVLALKRLRPAPITLIADGELLLAERECVGGGWNYGNRTILGEDLPAFIQTTAAAVLALQGSRHVALADRGRRFLVERWRDEPGGLTLAVTLAALRTHGLDTEAGAVADTLGTRFDRTAFLGDTVALAWAVLAAGPGIDHLRVGQ